MAEFYEDRPFFRELQGKKDIVGVEIGVMGGRNAEDILLHLDIKKLYLIDPWCSYDDMPGHGTLDEDVIETCYQGTLERMRPFYPKVTILRDTSKGAKDFIPNNLDFVYIDGNHRYRYVVEDIKYYMPKVKIGSFIAGHDFKTGEQGVMKAVLEAFDNRFIVKPPAWDWWHKKEKNDDEQALANTTER